MRMVMDSISYDAIGPVDWPHKIGYVNGRTSAWTAGQVGDARDRGQLLALVDVLGTDPGSAAVLDVERGDVTAPAVIRQWVIARNQYRADAVIYCSRDSLPGVISALAGEPCRIWLADPTDNGEPLMEPPDLGLPAHVTLAGLQYVLSPRSGGDYDLSIFYDDAWHGDPESAAAARLQASIPGPKAEAAALPAAGAPAPPAPETLSPAATGGTPAAATVSDPAAIQPVAVLGADGRDSGRTMFEARTAPIGPDGSVAAADVAKVATLPHGFIQRVIADIREVARLFRGADAASADPGASAGSYAAVQLERAADAATEVGALLQKAGM